MTEPARTTEKAIAERIRLMAADPRLGTAAGLESTLRLLAKWRAQIIDRTIVARHGTTIQAGPFAGMHFVTRASEAGVAPKLLGCYEAALQPVVEEIVEAGFRRIVDIGCADGYYAVGLARRLPAAEILAFDIDPVARDHCAALAEANEVADRVTIAGEFRGEDFGRLSGPDTLVFIDAEGAEDELLDPAAYPALTSLTILAECHDGLKPGLAGRIAERFAESHLVRRIEAILPSPALPSWFDKVSELDRLLAVWEWRNGPTPWLFMKPISAPA